MVSYQKAKRCVAFIFITCAHVMHSDIEDELGTLSHELTLLAREVATGSHVSVLCIPTKKLKVSQDPFTQSTVSSTVVRFDADSIVDAPLQHLLDYFFTTLNKQLKKSITLKKTLALADLGNQTSQNSAYKWHSIVAEENSTNKDLGASHLCYYILYNLIHAPERLEVLKDVKKELPDEQQESWDTFINTFMAEACRVINEQSN